MRYLVYTIAFADGRSAAAGPYLPPVGRWESAGRGEDGLAYTSVLDEPAWRRLEAEWSLARPEPSLGAVTARGQRVPGVVHLLDPMDWNAHGVTAVRDASLFVSAPLR